MSAEPEHEKRNGLSRRPAPSLLFGSHCDESERSIWQMPSEIPSRASAHATCRNPRSRDLLQAADAAFTLRPHAAASLFSRSVAGGTVPQGMTKGDARSAYAAWARGRRPRLVVCFPGILPAQLSQRSACLAPRRGSVNVRRRTAPLPSSTSAPQLSQTKIVFRAMTSPFASD